MKAGTYLYIVDSAYRHSYQQFCPSLTQMRCAATALSLHALKL
jgi:DNA/RNA-binding domain of Phe-tRNA-synthetase-like protein